MEKVPFGWKEQPVEIFFPSSFLSLEKKIDRDRRGYTKRIFFGKCIIRGLKFRLREKRV